MPDTTHFASDGLQSTRNMDVALALSNRWLEEVKKDGSDGPDLARRLKIIRRAVWNLDESNTRISAIPLEPEKKTESFNAALQGLVGPNLGAEDKAKKIKLLESYARLGHIYEVSGLVARENYFEHCRATKDPIPGGVNAFLNTQADIPIKEVLAHIEKPVFEVVMTQHPTNVNSLEFMQAQRALAIEVENENKGKPSKLTEALSAFQKAAIIKTQVTESGKKLTSNLTVREEIDTIANTLENLYHDIPRVFAQYDRPLVKREGYNPKDLKLNMRFASWGSAGDKDGNNSITAFHTLEAIALHTKAILEHYDYDLGELVQKMPELQGWKDQIFTAKQDISELAEKTKILREEQEISMGKFPDKSRKPSLSPEQLNEQFDEYSLLISKIRKGLDKKDFQNTLESAYEKHDRDPKVLELLRRARTFGFTFTKIEYRETAEEYTRVVARLLGADANYKKAPPAEKERMLTEKLQHGLGHEFDEKLQEILKTGAGRAYKKDGEKKDEAGKKVQETFDDLSTNALAISYNSLKRMQLAREHDDMITDNVLAECGKAEEKPEFKSKEEERAFTAAQGAANLLEAQFLQNVISGHPAPNKALGIGPAGKATLGIVPLFEEPETMEHIDAIMAKAYDNPAYQQQMKDVAVKYYGGEKTQQVQIAHSDNARRSGLQAARGFIHDAHDKITKLNKERGIKTEFFEGGSMSDAYRNGLRCPSGIVNAFEMHDFAKFTFQGGDLLNYFNIPCATERLFSRNLSEQARGLAKKASGLNGKVVATAMPYDPNKDTHPNKNMNKVAISALQATLSDYEQNDFTQEKMGKLLQLLDYDEETKAGNSTSRAAARGDGFAGKVKMGLGAIGASEGLAQDAAAVVQKIIDEPIREVKKLLGIKIDNIRTIAYSESSQHAGLVLSWVGSDHLLDHIGKAIVEEKEKIGAAPKTEDEAKFMTAFKEVVTKPDATEGQKHYTIRAEHIRELYQHAPAFKDAQDRSAFAIAMTNMKRVETTAKHNALDAKKFEPDSGQAEGLEYLEKLKKVFKRAGWIAAVSHTKTRGGRDDNQVPAYQYEAGDYNQIADNTSAAELKKTSDTVAERLEYMRDEIQQKRGFRSFGIHIKTENDLDDYMRRLVHDGVDTVVHGRWLVGDISSAESMHEFHKNKALDGPAK